MEEEELDTRLIDAQVLFTNHAPAKNNTLYTEWLDHVITEDCIVSSQKQAFYTQRVAKIFCLVSTFI